MPIQIMFYTRLTMNSLSDRTAEESSTAISRKEAQDLKSCPGIFEASFREYRGYSRRQRRWRNPWSGCKLGGHQLQEKEVEGWLATLNRFLTLQCLLDDIVFVLYLVHGTNTMHFMTQITYLAGIVD